jgi:hypothetical protein
MGDIWKDSIIGMLYRIEEMRVRRMIELLELRYIGSGRQKDRRRHEARRIIRVIATGRRMRSKDDTRDRDEGR